MTEVYKHKEEKFSYNKGEKVASYYSEAIEKSKLNPIAQHGSGPDKKVIKPEEMPWEYSEQGILKHIINEKLAKDFPKQILGVKDSSYNLYEVLKIPNFLIFSGSEVKLLKGLELGNSGIISAICNVTASLARKVYDDFHNKKKQTFNEKLCAVRKVFDNYNLISALHTFMSFENEKYKRILPPLSLLSDTQQKEFMSKLKKLEFHPEKDIAA